MGKEMQQVVGVRSMDGIGVRVEPHSPVLMMEESLLLVYWRSHNAL